jgi:hypothetical protein
MFTKSFIVLGIFSLLLSFNTFAGKRTVLYVNCNGTYVPCANNPNIDGLRYCPTTNAGKNEFCASTPKGTK